MRTGGKVEKWSICSFSTTLTMTNRYALRESTGKDVLLLPPSYL